jgi:hypothetical protein
MRTESERKRLKFFMVGLFFIALAINSLFRGPERSASNQTQAAFVNPARIAPEPSRSPKESAVGTSRNAAAEVEASRKTAEEAKAARRAAEEAEAERKAAAARVAAKEEHERYLARYLNFRNPKTAGTQTVAVVVISESGRFNFALNRALADRLKGDSAQLQTSLFTPDFVSDGLFASTFDNAHQVSKKLDLADFIDLLVLARQKVRYTVNHALEDVMSAHMDLEIGIFDVKGTGDSSTYTLTANGAGFKENSARQMAEERLIKQIAKDSKISLNR